MEQHPCKNIKSLKDLVIPHHHHPLIRITPGYTPARNLAKSLDSEVGFEVILMNISSEAFRRCQEPEL